MKPRTLLLLLNNSKRGVRPKDRSAHPSIHPSMKPRTLLLCFSLEWSRHLIAALVVFPGKTRISRDRRRSQRHNHFHYNMHKTPQELKNIKNTTTTKIKTSCFPQFFLFPTLCMGLLVTKPIFGFKANYVWYIYDPWTLTLWYICVWCTNVW